MENKEDYFKTRDVINRSGITRQMFYNYLNAGLIQPVKVSSARHRLFDESVFKCIKSINILKEKGYTLREIKTTFRKLEDYPRSGSDEKDYQK